MLLCWSSPIAATVVSHTIPLYPLTFFTLLLTSNYRIPSLFTFSLTPWHYILSHFRIPSHLTFVSSHFSYFTSNLAIRFSHFSHLTSHLAIISSHPFTLSRRSRPTLPQVILHVCFVGLAPTSTAPRFPIDLLSPAINSISSSPWGCHTRPSILWYQPVHFIPPRYHFVL